jgi:hypothetical protein
MHPIDFKNVPAHVTSIALPTNLNDIRVVVVVSYDDSTDTLTLASEYVTVVCVNNNFTITSHKDALLLFPRHAMQIADQIVDEFHIHYRELDESASPAEVREYDFDMTLRD